MNARYGSRSEFARLRRSAFHTFHSRERSERSPVQDQVADGIFDAAVSAAAHLGVTRADPGIPGGAFRDIAARNTGIRVQPERLLDLLEAQIADADFSRAFRQRENRQARQ